MSTRCTLAIMRTAISVVLRLSVAACALLLAACSPHYNWREVRGAGAPFTVTLPGKPASHARAINLGGVPVTMTMTAADVEQVTFAVGAAELPDAAQAEQALGAMKVALVNNIGGTLAQEKAVVIGGAPAIAIEASGPPATGTGGRPRLLLARFMARGNRAYQLVVVGAEKAGTRDAADIFFTSFKPG